MRVKSFGFILVSGGRLAVGMRLPEGHGAAAAWVVVAAGRAAEVAGRGERLPFSAGEVAVLVSGGDGRCGAVDVARGAAECQMSRCDPACLTRKSVI